MAFTNLIDDLKRILLLVLVALPLIASANIDCNGKSFHCLNSTHFMICVDLGGGRSSTVDDFVIPCPPPTVCHGNNRFECEFPPSTPAPILVTTASDVTNNAITSDATVAWEEINVTSTMYETVSKEERLESSPVSLTQSLNDSVTTELIPTKQLISIETNVNTAENNFTTTTTQSPTTENSVSAINNTTGKAVSSEPRVEINTVSLITSLNDSVTTELIPTEQIDNIKVTNVRATENSFQTSVVIESVSTGQTDNIDIKSDSQSSNFSAATESLNTASSVVNGTPSINNVTEKPVNPEASVEVNTVSSMTSINDNVATELIPTKLFNNSKINATENKFTTSAIEFLTTNFPTVSTIHSINNVTEKTVINVTGLETNKVISTIMVYDSVTTELIPTEQINNIGINVKATENNFTTTNTDSELMTIDGISAINNVTEKVVSTETRVEITTANLTTSQNDSVTTELISSGQINNIETNVNATENYLKTTVVIESVSSGEIDTIDIKANAPRYNFTAATESLNTASMAVNGIPSINNVTEKPVNPEAGLEVNTVSPTTSINDNVTTKLISTAPTYDIEINVNATENNFPITVATESVSTGQIDSTQININETETEFTTTTLESLTTKLPTVNDILATSNVIEKPVNSEVGLEINSVSSTTLLNDSLTTELIPMGRIDNISVKANAMENIFLTTNTTEFLTTEFTAENGVNHITENAISKKARLEIKTVTLTTLLEDSITDELIQTEQINNINLNTTENYFTTTLATELISTGQIENIGVKSNATGNSVIAATESVNTASTAVHGILTINNVTENAVNNEGRYEITTVSLTTPFNYSVATESVSTGLIDNMESKEIATESNFAAATESLNTKSTTVNGLPAINNFTEKEIINEGRFEITTVSLTKPLNYSTVTDFISTRLSDNIEIKANVTDNNFRTTVATEFVSTSQKANATESKFTATTESSITESMAVNDVPDINKMTERASSNGERFEVTTVSLTTPLNYSVATESISTGQIDNIEIKANATENKFTTSVIESLITDSPISNDIPNISNVTEKANTTLIDTKNTTNNDVVNKETITNLMENNITDIASLTETTSNLNFNTSTKHVTTPNILISSTEYGFIVPNTNANLEVIKAESNKKNDFNSISTTADMFNTSKSIQNNSTNPEEYVISAGNVTDAHLSATESYNAIPVTNENTGLQNISEVLEPNVVFATQKPTETTSQVSEDVDATFNIFTRLESASTISGKMVMKTENNVLNEVITATDNISAQTTTFINTANNISVTEKKLISKELTTGAHSTIDFSGTAYELTTSSSSLEPSINVPTHAMTTAAVDNNTVITTENYSLNNINTNTTAVLILQMTTDLPSVKVVTTETLPEGITLPRNNTMVYTNHNNSNINSSSIPQIIEENGIKNHTTNFLGNDTTINTSDLEEIVNNTNETVSLKSQNLQTSVVPTYYTTLPVAQSDTTEILSPTTNQTLKIKSEEIISNTLIPGETVQITAQFQEISTITYYDQAVTENILSTKMELSNQNITTGPEIVFKDSDLTTTKNPMQTFTKNITEPDISTITLINIDNKVSNKLPEKNQKGTKTFDENLTSSIILNHTDMSQSTGQHNFENIINSTSTDATQASKIRIIHEGIEESTKKASSALNSSTQIEAIFSSTLRSSSVNVEVSQGTLNLSLSHGMVLATSSTNISQEYNMDNNFVNSQIVTDLPFAMKNSETKENESSITFALPTHIVDFTHSPEKKSHTEMSTENVERALDIIDLAPSVLQESKSLQIEKNGVTTTSPTISSDYIIVTPQKNLQGSMYTTKIEMSTYTVTKQDEIIGNTQNTDEVNPSSLKQYSDLHKTPDQVFTEKLVGLVGSAKGVSNGVSLYPEFSERYKQESILKHSTTQAPLLKPNSYPQITTSVTSGKGKSSDIFAPNTIITNPQFSTTVKSIETNGNDRKIMPVEQTEILPITTPVLTILEVIDTTTMPSVDETPELSGQNFGTDNHSIIDFNTETISESVIQNRQLSEEIPASSTIASEFLSMNINETLSNSTQNKVVITESGQGYTEIVNTENAAVTVGTNLSNSYQQTTNEDKVKEDKETHSQLSKTNSSTNAHQFINNTDKRTDILTSPVVSDETTKNDSLAQVEVITNISPSQHTQLPTFKPSVVTFSITESTPSISTTVSQFSQFQFDCRHRKRGKYAANEDCRKFYTCVGLDQPIFGFCPVNTVFSDIKKQCTKNLSHCIRDNQFKCVSEGRFVNLKENNVFYICVKNNLNSFVKFKFICQNGYYLDKASVRCIWNQEPINQSVSNDSISKSTPDKKSKEDENPKKKENRFECEEEGKFPDPRNCRKFYICSKSSKSDEFRKRRKKCDSDEVFHKNKKKCVDAESYECS